MPAPLDISRDAVKTLALQIGLRPAARQLGIPVATIGAWSARDPDGPWFKPKTITAPTVRPQTVQTTAADALKQRLSDDHSATKIGLSTYARKAAEKAAASNGDHKLARSSKDIADIMEKVHGAAEKGSSGIHIGVLTGQVAIQYNPD